MSTTKAYDNLNRLTGISSTPSADATVSFKYAYNSANQRTAITNAYSSRWALGYDSLGQVPSGRRYWSDGNLVAGQQFEYGFDDIGNRRHAASGGDSWGANLRYQNYTANSLNQYVQHTVPGYLNVLGAATNTATVIINLQPTTRKSRRPTPACQMAPSSNSISAMTIAAGGQARPYPLGTAQPTLPSRRTSLRMTIGTCSANSTTPTNLSVPTFGART